MKILNHFKSGLLKLMLAAMAATPFAVSCYDDTGIREELDMLVDKVYELEERLNNEINALRAMMDGKAMISSIIVSPEGITTIKLSTGAEFQLYPEQDMKSFITYMPASINGENVDCWAYIDENGVKRYMRDANGDPIPVAAATPKVVEIDGETYLEMGGELYPLSGNSVFSDYELIKDELTGDVYAVTFTFGEDMSFTVTVDGACGFSLCHRYDNIINVYGKVSQSDLSVYERILLHHRSDLVVGAVEVHVSFSCLKLATKIV